MEEKTLKETIKKILVKKWMIERLKYKVTFFFFLIKKINFYF